MVNWQQKREGKSVFQQMTAGYAYRPDDECIDLHRRVTQLTQVYAQQYYASDPMMTKTLNEMVGSLGEGSMIRPAVSFDYGVNTHIGAGCFFNFGCIFLDVAPITFNDGVLVGPNVQFLTPTHPLNPVDREALWEGGLPITVGRNVWIGGGAIILPGVTIGENAVIGAGAVVSKDIPANAVAVGNPAKVVRYVAEDERPTDPNHQYSPQALRLA